jgi:hypothetical protein
MDNVVVVSSQILKRRKILIIYDSDLELRALIDQPLREPRERDFFVQFVDTLVSQPWEGNHRKLPLH